MTVQERRDKELRDEHPNLWDAVRRGTLPEANDEFVKVAAQYPLSR